ncbi:hypothetical protein pdam_00018464 [Pocillopora damicornis]|uniref:Uncharacterized protein n=1 Tax=Pocillopora damicornis TaxID=46731 RepID=A0A3M6UED6_POCDA|nr:hypothetical protein pdam_00018464 [Pocillopora damicornis]
MTPIEVDVSWQMENSESDDSDECGDKMDVHSEKSDAINKLLILEGHKPLTHALQVPWTDASEKTKRFYTSKMSEFINSLLEVVAPNDAGLLWRALKELRKINQRYDDFKSSESTLLTALIESYKQATHHSASQQILSVIADKLSFTDLHSCSASVRRCMQGLNNYLAGGARAFDELSSIVDKLSEIGLEKDVADRLKESLKSGKQYLKGDYKVHVALESTIPDHCRAFALSDPANSFYQTPCNHEHKVACDRCSSLCQVCVYVSFIIHFHCQLSTIYGQY